MNMRAPKFFRTLPSGESSQMGATLDAAQPPSSQRSKTQTLSLLSTKTLLVCAQGRDVCAQSFTMWYGLGASLTHMVWASAAADAAVMANRTVAVVASVARISFLRPRLYTRGRQKSMSNAVE